MYKTKRCNHCGKDINERLTVCPFCGGYISDTKESIPPRCPRCRESLQVHIQKDEEYDLCPGCGGLWLDRVEFHRATRESDVYREEGFDSEYLKKPLQDTVTYISCVRCGKKMNRKNFARISGVIIDECSKHGVWLDAGEFEKIRHFIADGGLERAQDREIEKNRIEIERLAVQVDQTAFIQRLLNFWNFKRWLFGDKI